MSFSYEKYSEKSFVARGSILNNMEKRKELTKQLQGNSIWNNRLKNGPGMLIAINDNNSNVLDKFKSLYENEQTEIVGELKKDIDVIEIPKRENENEKDKKHIKSTPKSDYSSSSSSDSESDSDSDKKKHMNRRKIHSVSDNKYSKSSSHSDTESDSDSDHRRSKRSTPSSSEEDDSSEDERIQYSIRRKQKNDSSHKEERFDTILSDDEDCVTLSRRSRYFLRTIKELKDQVSSLQKQVDKMYRR